MHPGTAIGRCQSIGDFAHQLVGHSAILFWMVIEQKICVQARRESWLAFAKRDLLLAREYWELANDRGAGRCAANESQNMSYIWRACRPGGGFLRTRARGLL